MSQHDPTAVEVSSLETSFREMTIEEMAAIQAMEAAVTETPETMAETAEAAARPAIPLPGPIPVGPAIPLLKRAVSGRYRSPSAGFQLELRVDVDRTRPMNRLSGDFYQVSGSVINHFGSFIVNSPTISVTSTQVVIRGLGSYTFSAGAPVIQVTIQRRSIFQSQAPAMVQFFTVSNQPGASYTCAFESVYFRSVRLETDSVSDVTTPIFNTYNTGSLPSGGPARNLSVAGSYAEAGIEMIPTSGNDVIKVSEAGGNVKWSNAELHASMEKHFTLWKDLPQWAVWLVAAQLHDNGPGLYGIMFDQAGKQRQGCAVFHAGIGGTATDKLRLQLYTYVHELGHCFNLLHSWQKSLATPPQANRPSALSWMNYPWYFPGGGASAYWNSFPFQFDNEEIIHLRHAFRDNVIMGGKNFAVGSALGAGMFEDSLQDQSGLRFTISTHTSSFGLGEPVVMQLALGTNDARGKRAHNWLHPNFGLVGVAIRKPGGEVKIYEPLIDHCVNSQTEEIGPQDTIHDSAYIGYGKDGLYFDQPGRYQVRAVYSAMDGSPILSDVLTIRVRYPVTAAEEQLADLFMGEDQGTLLYLLGSDADSLRSGNKAFDEVLERHGKHPMANYVRLIKGINAGRNFKTINDEKESRVSVRKPKSAESAEMLAAVVDSNVLDGVSADMVMTKMAAAQELAGDKKAAAQTLSKLEKSSPGRAKSATASK